MFFFLQIIITVIILVLLLIPSIYLVIGAKLLAISKREQSCFKARKARFTLIAAVSVILALVFFWWKIVSYLNFPYVDF